MVFRMTIEAKMRHAELMGRFLNYKREKLFECGILSFATVKLRTKVTKGAGSKLAAEMMTFKLLKECEKKWRKINGVAEIKNLLEGLAYEDGIMLPSKTHHETAAS